MALAKTVLDRIEALGGSHGEPNLEMEPSLRSFAFPHPLFEATLVDDNVSPEEARDWLAVEAATFHEQTPRFLKSFYIRTFDGQAFTPFTEGTSDFNGWGELDETYFRSQVAAPTMEFIEIGFKDGGFPDLFYVCLSDPDQTNPQIYATEHGESWQQIWQEGDLLAFLHRYLTPTELLAKLENIASTTP